MPKPSEISEWKERYYSYSDERLLAEKHQWVEHSEMHIAAVQLLHERQKAREEANHAQLLAEIKRPHWSVTPLFLVSVVGAVAAVVAAYYAYLAYSQPQQLSSANQQSQNESSMLQKPSPPLPVAPPASSKR